MSSLRRWLLGVLATLSICTAAIAAEAQPPGVASTDDHVHHGFRMGVRLGVGQLAVSFQDSAIWGRIVPIEISAGVALTRNLAVFGALYGAHMVTPVSDDVRVDSLDLYGFGPGVSYRLEPLGIVFSGTLLASQVHATGYELDVGFDRTSHWGLTGRFSAGKDWLVSPRWRLGFAGEAVFGWMKARREPFDAVDDSYAAKGAALTFSASYQPPSPRALGGAAAIAAPGAGAHAHDGFHLNTSLGLAWLRLGTSSGTQASGVGSSVALSAGYGVTHGLVVFGELYEAFVSAPGHNLADLELHGFGPGLKWYWMPINAFVSATLLFSQFSFHNDIPADGRYGISSLSDWRLTGRASIGKEWWVSTSWGLGIAAELFYGRMPARFNPSAGLPYSFTIAGGALLLSATFG